MTMTRARLIDAICARVTLSRSRSRELISSLFEIMMSSLVDGEPVLLSGFGKFTIKQKKQYHNFTRRDRRSMAGARRVVAFKCSPVLREKLNEQGCTDTRNI